MSLIPSFYNDDWMSRPRYFSRYMDDAMRDMVNVERQMTPYWMGLPLRQSQSLASAVGDVVNDSDKFQVAVDVSHFRPEELKVTMADNMLTVTGKHEEKTDEHGQIERHFVRKYTLPKEVQAEAMQSQLSGDGVLTIMAPKTGVAGSRNIPITLGGGAAKAVEGAKAGDKKK